MGEVVKRVFKSSAILFLSNCAETALFFLLTVVIARYLGEVGLGRYSFVLTVIFFFGVVAEFGLSTILTREIAQDNAATNRYLVASILLKIVISLTLISALFILTHLLKSKDSTVLLALKIGSLLLLLSSMNSSFTAVFRSYQRMHYILFLNIGGWLIQLGGAILLLKIGYGLVAIFTLMVIVQLGRLVGGSWIYRSHLLTPSMSLAISFKLLGSLFRNSFPFALAGLLAVLYLKVDIVMLSLMRGDQDVGWYTAATRFIEALKIAPNAFFGAIFPVMSIFAAPLHFKRGDLDQTYGFSLKYLLFFSLISASSITLLARPLMMMAYGYRFTPSILVLRVLAWTLIPLVTNSVTVLYLFSLGCEKQVNIIRLIGLGFNILTNWLLIPRWGILGATATTLASEILVFFLLLPQLRRARYAGSEAKAVDQAFILEPAPR